MHIRLLIEPVWNWNNGDGSGSVLTNAFNRTSMELKPIQIILTTYGIFAFNRTSMELKLLFDEHVNAVCRLLIEPVWNWNAVVDGVHLVRKLLIEPVWNWNIYNLFVSVLYAIPF